jgi:hypothetical protein
MLLWLTGRQFSFGETLLGEQLVYKTMSWNLHINHSSDITEHLNPLHVSCQLSAGVESTLFIV